MSSNSIDDSTLVDVAEAMVIVQKAIEVGKANGIGDEGVLIGMNSPVGRFVIYVGPNEVQAAELPVFTEPEEAVTWITTADREDTFQVQEMMNAIANWKRLASPTLKSSDLYELGEAVIASVVSAAHANPFDEQDWE